MKPLRDKLRKEASHKKIAQYVIEKDYALSYVLVGITQQPDLAHSLIFKGGTALKKVFFGDYRFSEDLDFSVLNAPKNKALEKALLEAAEITKTFLTHYGPFDLQLKRNTERAPHPKGQEAFSLFVKFPWQSTPLCRIKIEITHDEPIILQPEYRYILHGYGENLNYQVACYPIEEIIAEKLRALLQTHQKLVTRGWNRPRARDYYDLWFILKNYSDIIKKEKLIDMLEKKCKHRMVSYQTIDDFFTPILIREAHQHWQNTLGDFVQKLPECHIVLEETKYFVSRFF